jgi:hypothetical protein
MPALAHPPSAPGDAVTLHAPGSEIVLTIESPGPKPGWSALEEIAQDPREPSGREIASAVCLEMGGAFYLLRRCEPTPSGGRAYRFSDYPSGRMAFPDARYPDDEIARLGVLASLWQDPGSKVVYAVPGDRLEIFAEGEGEGFTAALDAKEPKARWVAWEDLDQDAAGFQDIGLVAALAFRGKTHQLRRVERRPGGGVRYLFGPWPANELRRAVVNYPDDELARLEFERLAKRQEDFKGTRWALGFAVGGLPARWQQRIADKLRLNLYGASKRNAYASGAVAAAAAIPLFVLQPAAGGPPLPPWLAALALYLMADSALRVPAYWMDYLFDRFWDRRDSTELGYLALEMIDELLKRAGR